jgi:hypothetical protein
MVAYLLCIAAGGNSHCEIAPLHVGLKHEAHVSFVMYLLS